MFANHSLFSGTCSYFVSKVIEVVVDYTGISRCSRWCSRTVTKHNEPSAARGINANSANANGTGAHQVAVVSRDVLAAAQAVPAADDRKSAGADEKEAPGDANRAYTEAPPYLKKQALLLCERQPGLTLDRAVEMARAAGAIIWTPSMDLRYDLLLQYLSYRRDFEAFSKPEAHVLLFEEQQRRRGEYSRRLALTDVCVEGIRNYSVTPDGQRVDADPIDIDLHGIPLTTSVVRQIAGLCPEARSLNMSDTFLPAGVFPSQPLMTAIRQFTQLETLNLSGNAAIWIFPRALSRFFSQKNDEPQAWSKLTTLVLQRVFTDGPSIEELGVLSVLPCLKTLDLSGNAQFGRDVEHADMIASIEGLTKLIVKDCPHLTDAFIQRLAERAPRIVLER